MKLIIAGGREFSIPAAYQLVSEAYQSQVPHEIKVALTEVVHGGCRGIDEAADAFARNMQVVKVVVFPADWTTHGKAAGPIRNAEMAKYGDALLLIWDGQSRGSASMKREMEKAGKPVYEVIAAQGRPA